MQNIQNLSKRNSKKYPQIIAIVSNWNGMSIKYNDKSILKLCLNSLSKTDYPNLKIVLSDPSSIDNSVKFTKKNFPLVDVFVTEDSGLAGTINKSLKYSLTKYKHAKYFIWLNNDMIFEDKNWIRTMLKTFDISKSVGIVGCKLIYPNGRIQHAGMAIGNAPRNLGRGEIDNGQYDKIIEVEAVTGAALMVKKDVIQKIGMFDERFFRSTEDADFCLRARNSGFNVFYNGNTRIIHLEGFSSTQSTSKERKMAVLFEDRKSRIFFLRKHKYPILNFIIAITIYFGEAIFSIEGKDRKRNLINIKLKKNVLYNLIISIKAIFASFSMKI